MARPCIDWTPPDGAIDAPDLRVLHITKVPPSDSGVARHAYAFDRALDALGSRTTLGLPIRARESQRVGIILGLARELARRLSGDKIDVVVIDLAGRSLAEFYAACVAALWPRVSVWLVIHDAPSIVGPPCLISMLDRKGGRRIGVAVSRVIGARLERWLLGRAERVIAFSEPGARALRDRFGATNVWAVPLPVEPADRLPKQPVVYCPAGVSAELLQPTMRAFESPLMPDNMRLRVGNMSASDRDAVRSWATRIGIEDRVELLEYQDQRGLDESFATAAVVVRHMPGGHAANLAAASSPVMSAMAAGCALVSTDTRGSQPCVASAAIDLSESPETLSERTLEIAADFVAQQVLGATAAAHVKRYHEPDAVSQYLLQVAIGSSRESSLPAASPHRIPTTTR